ncbi:hypothetical protein EDB86DRAFT_2980122 [Lactarius hatsudake]|nr:hypothetical protein EDB86DRAFT_2980122 [Lactarius hatsudake]
MSYVGLRRSQTHLCRIAKAACGCDEVGSDYTVLARSGRQKQLCMLLHGTTLRIGTCLYWKHVGFRLLWLRANAVRSGEETWSLLRLGQVIEGRRRKWLRTLLRGATLRIGDRLYWKRIGFRLLRPRANAARSGEDTWSLLGQVVKGRRKWLRTLLRGATLHIGNRLYWKRVGFRLLRPRANAERSGEDTWSLLGQVVKGRRKRCAHFCAAQNCLNVHLNRKRITFE